MHVQPIPVQATGSTRITQLDGLRGIAISMVFLFHAFRIPGLWMGVDLFFVLSGFLITGILVNQKTRPFGPYIGHFYTRRARRILPPYLMVLLISGLIFGFAFLRYGYMLLGLMNFQGTTSMPVGPQFLPLWSLAVEEQFYFVWPLVVYVLSRRRLITCAVGLILVAPILRYVCTPFWTDQGPINQWLPFRMDTLAAGALLALLWPRISREILAHPALGLRIKLTATAVAVLSFTAFMAMHHFGATTTTNTRAGNTLPYTLVVAVMFSVVLLALLGAGKRFLDTWVLMWLGRISFSLYLIHLTVLHFTPRHNPWIALSVSLAYSVAMWFLIEKPIISPGQNKERILVPAT